MVVFRGDLMMEGSNKYNQNMVNEMSQYDGHV